jgi:hypothetical protein
MIISCVVLIIGTLSFYRIQIKAFLRKKQIQFNFFLSALKVSGTIFQQYFFYPEIQIRKRFFFLPFLSHHLTHKKKATVPGRFFYK